MICSCTVGQFHGRCGKDTQPVLTLHCSTLLPASSISSLRDSIFEGCTWKFVPEVLWAWLYLGKKSFIWRGSIFNKNLHLWLPWNWFLSTGNKPHSSRGFPTELKGSEHTSSWHPDIIQLQKSPGIPVCNMGVEYAENGSTNSQATVKPFKGTQGWDEQPSQGDGSIQGCKSTWCGYTERFLSPL